MFPVPEVRRRRLGVGAARAFAVAVLALTAGALTGAAQPASAADGSCSQTGAQTVCTFAYTGAAQTWTVPAGVTQASFDVYGAEGGRADGAQSVAGLGGRATATVAVAPGETLQITVGGAGVGGVFGAVTGFGGFNGGGRARASGGGGGGGSDVRQGGTALSDRVLVAGGGGGTGPFSPNFNVGGGSGGGLTGGHGGHDYLGGGGGTQSAGGTGGRSNTTADGGLGVGGWGCASSYPAGGGGGGYYGGGGGCQFGGGGGGSGFGPDGVVFETGVRAGDGLITITYTDTTAPTTTIALDPAAANGSDGWYTTPVGVTVSAGDPDNPVAQTRCALDPAGAPSSFADLPAGCAFADPGADVSGDGRHVLYAASTDSAGNTETPVSRAFKIDTTAPAVTCATVASYLLNEPSATVTATVSDATSGPAQSQLTAAADTSGVGAKSATLTGTDVAGNQTSRDCAYQVRYGFAGFDQPVDNLDANGNPVLNTVKAGRAIPLKWRLTDATGAPVSTLPGATISVASISCGLDSTLDAIEETAAGASGLQNLGNGAYQLNWKSPTSYAGSCKRLRLDLGEGSYRTADFKFTN